ncbi:MAG TPA: T9SS type A sorting domain-containing protein [Saprospiraceae bacterium]|nr:T9SS type A sorting domain-containing protein [Saprospiraceae bacterium]HMZ74491.1 T9SS type A sorting domain-containing protein [Saprospiraceae bacterium]HNA41907.1 T9SS type A sorting domain-containing protein [Saprospiraceae bacterium]HNA94438.1 T9SS type A sorting domain-containing protein [Saprospiraceae bacterium]HNE48451.1 T9SS type A sorting domain-containing protein [Saprospiraceae bacterium]
MRLVLLFMSLIFIGTLSAQNIDKRKEALKEIIREKLHTARFKQNFEKHAPFIIQKRTNQEIKLSNATSLDVTEAEPYIAINPTDTNNIVVSFMDFTQSLDFRIYYTLDGGATWQLSSFDPRTIYTQRNPGLQIAGGGDPIMDFDKNGKLYYGWLYLGLQGFTEGKFQVFWAWSDDKGATFNTAPGDNIYIAQGGLSLLTGDVTDYGDGIFDRPWFSVDKTDGPNAGTLYCAGLFIPNTKTTLAGNGIIVKRKLPGVDSFEYANTPVFVNENSQFSNIEVDDNGVVHVTYGAIDSSTIMHSRSLDGGLTFEPPTIVGTGKSTFQSGTVYVHARENPAPNLAREAGTNNLYLTWSSFGEKDLVQGFFAYSKDGGVTWSTPVNLSETAKDTGSHCMMPVVAANTNSGVTVSWYSVTPQKIGNYYVMRSTDGGLSFKNPVLVSSKATDFSVYPTGGFSPVFFGDYNKSINTDCRNLTIFSDGRDNLGPKIYISVVDYCNLTSIPELSSITDKISFRIQPNPVSSRFSLDISCKESTNTRITLIDSEGKYVKNLYNGKLEAGKTNLEFNIGAQIPAGIYFVVFDADNGKFVKKLIKE